MFENDNLSYISQNHSSVTILKHFLLRYRHLTVCICGKWRKILKTLTLIGQCPMSKSSELFPYPTTYSCFKLIHPLFFELSCTQTDTHTARMITLYLQLINRNYNYNNNTRYNICTTKKRKRYKQYMAEHLLYILIAL